VVVVARAKRRARIATTTRTESPMAEKKAAGKASPAKKKPAAPKKAAAGSQEDGAAVVLANLEAMPEADRAIGKRIHQIVLAAAPGLAPRLWYGMPAYANADGKVVCFFQSGAKFKTRYCTFGFQEAANLDDGGMWPTSYALTVLTDADAARVAELVRHAVRQAD
jgi:uncharacterized protein YdhG (YjbR/CyaY superfamily)